MLGAELATKRGEEFLGNSQHMPIGMWDTFLRGLCVDAAATETGKRRYCRHAIKIRATIDKWLHQGNVNVHQHATLLAAEKLTL